MVMDWQLKFDENIKNKMSNENTKIETK